MWLWLPMRLSSCNTDKFQFVWQAWKRGIRLWRRFFAPPLVSELTDGLRSNANPILRLGESQRGVSSRCDSVTFRLWRYQRHSLPKCRYATSRTSAKETKKQPSFLGSVVLLFGAGRGIRTPVPFGQTVFKTASLWPLRYSCVLNCDFRKC